MFHTLDVNFEKQAEIVTSIINEKDREVQFYKEQVTTLMEVNKDLQAQLEEEKAKQSDMKHKPTKWIWVAEI
jgi:hypothetical protein